VAKKLGEMWNNTASEDKQPYEKKASKLKEKYEKVRTARTARNTRNVSGPDSQHSRCVTSLHTNNTMLA
jgi:hypothetical protein